MNMSNYFKPKKTRNRTSVTTHNNSIAKTKQDLQDSGVSIISIREICNKCERIAELSWKLEKVQQEQFQSQQEIPTNNF